MSANEISERLAAACWVQCGSSGGEAINALANDQIRFRSLVGFQQRIITTTDANAFPLLILPLDRAFSRKECTVLANRLGTAGPGATLVDRSVYPFLTAPAADVPQIFVQPILLEWLGPDLSDPQFYPFGLVVGTIPTAPPVGANLDLFDAIAVLLPVPVANASSGDFCVVVLEHPPLEGLGTTLEAPLPVPTGPEDVFSLARAWFRSDTYEATGGEDPVLDLLIGRVGTEGNLDASGGPVPSAQAAFNNQDGFATDNALTSTMPAAFWNFLGSGNWTFYGVACPTSESPQDLLSQAVTLNFDAGPTGLITLTLGGFGELELGYPETAVNAGQWTKVVIDTTTVLPPGLAQLISTFSGPVQDALTGVPPGTVPATLQVLGNGAGEMLVLELLFWDFVLDAGQQLEVETYLNTRYGTPTPPTNPILALNPTAWFRGDTFTESGGFTSALTGRVGTEGNLVPQLLTYDVPQPVVDANNRLGLTYGDQANNNLVSSMPAAFWNFLNTKNSFFAAVFEVPGVGRQTVFRTATTDEVAFRFNMTTEQAELDFGAGVGAGPFGLIFPAANIGVKQAMQSVQTDLAAQEITFDVTPGGGQNGGDWNPGEPSGTVASTLQLGNTTASAELGAVVLLDLIFFDRALTPGEISIWNDYVIDRYGTF